jgi:isocitrate dehydrogenase
MKNLIIAVLLSLTTQISLASPTECYRSAVRAADYGGLGLMSSTAIQLCKGSSQASTECYRSAVRAADYGGLGLMSSAALDLCETSDKK